MSTFVPSLAVEAKLRRQRRRFGQRMALLCRQLEGYRQQMEQHFLTGVAGLAAGAFLLIRGLDPAWAVPLLAVLGIVGMAALQHLLIVFEAEMRATLLPAACEAVGRVRHRQGYAPDLRFDLLASLGMIPTLNRRLVEDVFAGEHRGRRFTLAAVDVFNARAPDAAGPEEVRDFRGLVAQIDWPEGLDRSRLDLLMVSSSSDAPKLGWTDGVLLVAMPRSERLLDIGGLFEPCHCWIDRLDRVIAEIELPMSLIDHLLGETAG